MLYQWKKIDKVLAGLAKTIYKTHARTSFKVVTSILIEIKMSKNK